ncbi:MAG: hypothetical protein ACT4OD_00690 [Candidatus Nitrosotenuis sp.]
MQGSFNTHLIGLSCIVFVVVAAFLIFDLQEKFYPVLKPYTVTIDYTETKKTMIAEPKELAEVSLQNTVLMPLQKQVFKSVRAENEPKSRLSELENKEFSLYLGGDAYLGISGVAKKANLALNLVPIKGTNLEQFQVLDSRLLLDNSGVSISGTGVEIEDRNVTLKFVSDTVGEFVIRATLDESILDDTNNKQSVFLEDQNFYLIKKEMPYRINMFGTLSS